MDSEFNKVLAVCLKFLSKETSRSAAEVSEIRASIEKLEHRVPDLPAGIVFESHLDHSVGLLESQVRQSTLSAAVNLESLKSTVLVLNAELKKTIQNEADIRESVSSNLESNLTSSINDNHQAFNAFVEHSTESVDKLKVELGALVSGLDALKYNTETSLRSALADEKTDRLNHALNLRVESDNKISLLDAALKNMKREFERSISETLKSTFDVENKLTISVKSLKTELIDVIKTKADVIHSHPEYCTTSELASLSAKLVAISEELADDYVVLTRDISKKANISDVLSKNDKSELISEISSTVLSKIKVPEDGKPGKDAIPGVDGKDAAEWDIIWHPTIKGRLGIKKEGWKDYKWQDLLVKLPAPSQGFGFMGGNGGSNSSVMSVNGKTGDVVLSYDDIEGSPPGFPDSIPEPGTINYDVSGNIDNIVVGTKTTTILRSGSTITGVNKGTYTKNFIRNVDGKITGWTID